MITHHAAIRSIPTTVNALIGLMLPMHAPHHNFSTVPVVQHPRVTILAQSATSAASWSAHALSTCIAYRWRGRHRAMIRKLTAQLRHSEPCRMRLGPWHPRVIARARDAAVVAARSRGRPACTIRSSAALAVCPSGRPGLHAGTTACAPTVPWSYLPMHCCRACLGRAHHTRLGRCPRRGVHAGIAELRQRLNGMGCVHVGCVGGGAAWAGWSVLRRARSASHARMRVNARVACDWSDVLHAERIIRPASPRTTQNMTHTQAVGAVRLW